MEIEFIVIIVLSIASFLLITIYKKKIDENKKISSQLIKYSSIISVDEELEAKTNEYTILKTDAQDLNNRYIDAKSVFDELEKDVELYKNDLKFINLGIYEPIFDFDTSEEYKEKITDVINEQKEMITYGNACVCNTNWTVDNSAKKGEVMTKRNINLTLRAFNGECNSLISKVKWNNVTRFEERIKKSFRAINRFGKSNNTFITESYLDLKLDELHLVYELELKKKQEKEEAREIRAQQREEERAQREFELARKEAEKEERRFQKALELAKKELGLVSGEKLEELNNQIVQLEQKLKDANEAKERAISRAQETKSGHVYIISNLGSFGENIYKIGMTRRLEPLDRVKELGDASVPFTFDLHAMMFSENAPELEKMLHKEFDDRRINKVNNRKEYFNVTLDEIEQVVKDKHNKDVNFIKVLEAQQFRETLAIIEQNEMLENERIEKEQKYPDKLF